MKGYILKLNRYEKKILKGIIDNRRGIYETPKRLRSQYKHCKEYDAALSLFMKKLIYAEATNEHGTNGMFQGPATDEPNFRWFTCCLLYTSPSPRDGLLSRMPSSA